MTRVSQQSEMNSFNDDEVIVKQEKISDVPEEKRIKLDTDTIFRFSCLVHNDHLVLILNEIGALSPYIYKTLLTLEEIQEKYKMFRSCDDLDEVQNHISKLFSKGKIKLRKGEDSIIFDITVFTISDEVDIQFEADRIMTTKKDDILLQLYKIEKDQNKVLKDIEEYLKNLGPDGNNLIKKINEFKQKFN